MRNEDTNYYVVIKNYYDGQEPSVKKSENDLGWKEFFNLVQQAVEHHETNDFIVQMAEVDMENGEMFRIGLYGKHGKAQLIIDKLNAAEGDIKMLTILSTKKNTHEPLTTEIERIKR